MTLRFNCSLPNKLGITLISLLLLFTHNAFANSDLGPIVGKKAPAITVNNTERQPVSIQDLSGDKGLVIVFFRSADWCPYCKKHLVELNDESKKFTELGYGLAAISYDDIETLQKFTKKKNIHYPLLSDQKAKTISDYNILNKDYSQGDDNYGIPYPGVVVIDNTGNVIETYFFTGYKNRVNFSTLYSRLKAHH